MYTICLTQRWLFHISEIKFLKQFPTTENKFNKWNKGFENELISQ